MSRSTESLSISPAATGADEIFDLDAAAELSGMHPEMILEFCRAHVVALRHQEDSPQFDNRGIHRLRLIETLRHDRGMSLRSIRFVVELMERLDTAETELRTLRERVR
ncbi:chaperone modulator CbpM [Luteolibacter luteus]|uniref:MerR family transcriptional regulator n=1 Tax=Luteolibacter luteus TaxID=2728835 RepID=A0A858REB6_9BACT|nr:chaperone modulator CbpM [Luteolibacter luteus]QJE95082.1 hypothetical protein HHL09_04600 [Luteolibacter luteus]